MPARDIRRILVVDDDRTLQRALRSALSRDGSEVRGCASARSARALLASWTPDLVLLDVTLPDGTGFDVLDALRAGSPTPLVVAISGTATPDQSFRLARLGVRHYLAKPFGVAEVREAIRRAAEEAPELAAEFRSAVGQRGLRDVEQDARRAMLEEALARTGNGRRAAARLLRVSRQAVQHMLKRLRGPRE
jgi:DNA-binding NtrC family response regulator